MNKAIRRLLILLVVALLIAGLLYQESKVKRVAQDINAYEEALDKEKDYSASLERRVQTLNKRLESLTASHDQLTAQNRRLTDSLLILNRQVRDLNLLLQQQSQRLQAQALELTQLRQASNQLVERIAQLRLQGNTHQDSIRLLDAQRAALDRRIGQVFTIKDSLERIALQSAADLAQVNAQYQQQEQVLTLIEQLKVNFITVAPRKSNDRPARRARGWHHTLIQVSLDAPNLETLRGAQFLVQIIDTQTGEVVRPRERSLGDDRMGETFTFNGNPVPTINYINYEEKTSNRYTIQVSYLHAGQPYPLLYGRTDIPL